MECLETLVGLRSFCGDDITSNALYINDLPMLSLRNLSDISTEEDVNGREYFKRIRKEAAIQVAEDILHGFPSYKYGQVLDTIVDGNFKSNNVCYESHQGVAGREIYRQCKDRYITSEVQWIEIDTCDTKTIEIFLRTKLEQTTIKADLVPGINRIPIEMSGDYLKIWFDATCLNFAEAECATCHVDACNCVNKCSSNCATINNCNEGELSDSFTPFTVAVSCICNDEEIVCKYAKQAKHMMRWYTAGLIFLDAIYSIRKNPLIRNGKENAARLYTQIMGGEDPVTGWEVKNNRAKYHIAKNQFYDKIHRDMETGRCFHCDGYQYVEIN